MAEERKRDWYGKKPKKSAGKKPPADEDTLSRHSREYAEMHARHSAEQGEMQTRHDAEFSAMNNQHGQAGAMSQ